MVQQACLVALALMIGSTTCVQAADFGDVDCPAGAKMKPKSIMCIPREPRNWIVCTGIANSEGEGLWKDTGVPCEQPPPRSPAEYRPVTAISHPPSLAPDAKRVMDQFRGIFFHCTSIAVVSWTSDACAEITQDFIQQTRAAGLPYAIVDAAETQDAQQSEGQAAGIPPGSELQWMMSFRMADNGEISLHPDLHGIVELVPGIWSLRPIIIGGDITMESGATSKDATSAAKDLLKADLEYLMATH